MAYKLRQQGKVAVAFTGDGGTSEGDFHEALNVAAVWDLPVIFIIENNGYGLSTPVQEQYRCQHLVDRAIGYGMQGVRIDGNNILSVVDTLQGIREYCIREQKPYLVECSTFRMRGHEEASGTKYVPQHLFDEWREKDPLEHYEKYLQYLWLLNKDRIAEERQTIQQYIDAELAIAYKAAPLQPNVEKEISDVYAQKATAKKIPPASSKPVTTTLASGIIIQSPQHDMRLVDAIRQGMQQSMEQHPNLILMGQDIAGYGGAF